VGLSDRRVRLVRAGGRGALGFVEDVGGRIERSLEAVCPVKRSRAPQLVDLAHLVRNLDLGLGRNLLLDQAHREDRGEVVRTGGLERVGSQRRRRRTWKIGHQVDPMRWDLSLAEQDLRLARHLSRRRFEGFAPKPTAGRHQGRSRLVAAMLGHIG
jgi:hypothetical protein